MIYTYDNGGNILSKVKYPYTVGAVSGAGTTISYTYGDSSWGDLLTAYNGEAITYDEIGNPLSYRNGMSFEWDGGRKLTSFSTPNAVGNYVYNADGIRVYKEVNGNTTEYYLNGSQIETEITNYGGITRRADYIYDENGSIYGFVIDNTDKYYYLKNVQGDIIGILDNTGTQIVEYSYDAWGKATISYPGIDDQTETEKQARYLLGSNNPFRYRSYYFDVETGLYYLNSRYYDPEIGRCISPDTTDVLTATPTAVTDKNLFAYCDNNPVMRADHGGEFWHIVAGAAIGGLFELGSQLLSGEEVNWAKVGVATLAGGVTAAVGPAAGAVISGAANVALDIMSGERDIKKLAVSGIVGAGASLLGSGVGKVTEKVGGKVATKMLGKMSKAKLKTTVTNLVPTIKGAERNAIKNISYLTSKYPTIGTQYFMSSHLGRILTTSIGQVAEGFTGGGASYIRRRYFPSW